MITPYFETETGQLFHGHVLDVLREMESESVDCVMTSPPYFGLRDYSVASLVWDGDKNCQHVWETHIQRPRGGKNHPDRPSNVGSERHMRETNIRGVPLESDFCRICGAWQGSLGLESTPQLYIQHLMQVFDEIKRVLKKTGTCWVNIGDCYAGSGGMGSDIDNKAKKGMGIIKDYHRNTVPGVKRKSLVGIPERFVIAMTDRGWIRRNTVIWRKRSCRPESATDRFTIDFDYLYFFTKSEKHHFEQQFEPTTGNTHPGRKDGRLSPKSRLTRKNWKSHHGGGGKRLLGHSGNYDQHGNYIGTPGKRNKRCIWDIPAEGFPGAHFAVYPEKLCVTPIQAGCPENGIALDPFLGSGTTAIVAEKLDRRWIGIELNQDYCDIAVERIKREIAQLKLELA